MDNNFNQNHYREITILFLAYEPIHALVDLAKKLSKIGFDILIVNDGSSEKFRPIFNEAKLYSSLIEYPKNEGKGYAIKYGVSYLLTSKKECRFFITADADGQHAVSDIVRVADELLVHNEIVLGMRTFNRNIPARSRFGNEMSKFAQTLITGKYLQDNQCGLRGFPIREGQWLLEEFGNRYEYEMNVISRICLHDMKYISLPIQTIYESGNLTSHFRPMRDTYRIQGTIIAKGFISILAMILQFVFTGLLYDFLFKGMSDIYAPMELSLLCATGVSFLFSAIFNTIAYKPRRKLYLIGKALLIDIIEMILVMAFLELFSRFLNWNIYLAFLLSFVLSIFPTFLFLKGFNKTFWKKKK